MDKVLVEIEIIYLLSVITLENMKVTVSHLNTKHLYCKRMHQYLYVSVQSSWVPMRVCWNKFD